MSHNGCKSHLRIIHNVYGAPSVNVFVNNKSFALNLNYKDFTDYLSIHDGHIVIDVKLLDGTLLTSTKFTAKDDRFTYIILGDINTLSTIQGKLFKENIKCSRPGYARINFFNGVYNGFNVDIYADDVKIIDNVSYGNEGNKDIQVGKVPINIEVKLTGTSTVIIGPQPLYCISGGVYTLVSSGTAAAGLILLSVHDNKHTCEILQPNFNVQNYMGKWYQIASIPQLYETNCARATAEYTLLSNRINVFNTCYDKLGNVVSTITGSGFPECDPSIIRVVFPSITSTTSGILLQQHVPNYLVHKTNYKSYAIVGSPTRTSFYILSRHPKMSQSKYLKILKYATKLGYDASLIRPNYHALSHNNSEIPIDNNYYCDACIKQDQ